MDGFGLREFQLYVLAFMPYSDHVAAALSTLNATWEDAKDALESAKQLGLTKMHHKADLEFSILGKPAYSEILELEIVDSDSGFEGSSLHGFDLPTFGDYMYLVNVTTNGFAWGHRFGRRPGTAVPPISAVEDLQTWKYVKDEVLGVLTNATMVEGFSYNEVYAGRIMDRRSGEQVEILAGFDVDLLQWVERPGMP